MVPTTSVTHWHEQYTDLMGNHPVAVAMWRPISVDRAVNLLSVYGLVDRVRLGHPELNANAAHAAALRGAHESH